MLNKQDRRKLLIFIKKILSDSLPYKNKGFLQTHGLSWGHRRPSARDPNWVCG